MGLFSKTKVLKKGSEIKTDKPIAAHKMEV